MRHIVALGTLCVGLIGPLAAQELGRDGLRLVFDTNTGVEANDNFALSPDTPEGGVIATQSLGVALLSETRNETFSFGLGAVYQLGTAPGTEIGTGWRDPTANLAYSRESAGAALELSAQFRREELGLGRVLPDLEDLEDQTILPSDLVDDLGRLDRIKSDVKLELGRADPLGLTLGANYDLRDYSNTTSPDLYDRRTTDLTSGLRLDLSPLLQMHLLAARSRYEADDIDATIRDTTSMGMRLDARLNASRRLSAGLSHDRVTTRETIEDLRQDTTERGISGTLGYAQDMPRGGMSATLGSEFSTTGRRNSLTFGRDLDLPRTRLNLQVGATGTADGPQAIGAVSYALKLARGSLTAGLERSARTTGEDEAILQTVASLAHRTQINAVSGMDLTVNYARVTGLTNPADDIWRGTVSASYNHALTRNWSLNVGLSHTREDDAASNAMFMSLGRRVTVRW